MPKGKRKARRNADSRQPSDEEYDTGDNMSVVSGTSDAPSSIAEGGAEEVDEIAAEEDFEDKLKDVIDGLTQKSAKGRCDCLASLKVALSKKFLYEFITDRKMTITDSLERCLKKGKGDEQALASQCAALLSIQLGGGDECEDIFATFRPILTTILADGSASSKARANCAEALGVMTFVASGELGQSVEVMKSLENIFRASYLKGDKSTPSHKPEMAALHNAALISWCLLLSIAPPSVVQLFLVSHLSKLPELLESGDVELRITTGEALALLYELAREDDEDFDDDNIDELCEKLKLLATDSNKHRAKKDRRQQRSSFRDILRAIEENDAPSYRVRFGLEAVHINSWTRKRQYDCLCHILGTGMNVHLQENELIRDIFGLGSPIPFDLKPATKVSKTERHMYNVAAFKARTKARSKFRDKRAVAVHIANS